MIHDEKWNGIDSADSKKSPWDLIQSEDWDNYLAQKALTVMRETDQSLFLTGKAWTGKSTLLQQFEQNSWWKNIIKLAPTGVAALHIGGVTIHRFFGFPIDITEEKVREWDFYMKRENRMLLKAADTIVIDEISMVRADLFDVIDIMCQTIVREPGIPFWWKQLIMIWDLFQLPPIYKEQEQEAFKAKYKTEFFFSSRAYKRLDPISIELNKVYRQTDKEFIHHLNKIRLWAHDHETLWYLERACIDSFEELPESTVVVTTTKKTAHMLNMQMLDDINEDICSRTAKIKGKFPQTMFPNDQELHFKVGAQVMMIKNHKDGNRYNGSIWIIKRLETDEDGEEQVIVTIDWVEYTVTQEQRDVFEPSYNEDEQTIEYNSIWRFNQYPFRLWWAITIHKSQWLTFDNVCIDLWWWAFVQGQTYVALSRAQTYDGVFLNRRITHQDIIVDPRVVKFVWKSLVPQNSELILHAIEQEKPIQFLYLNTKTNQIDTRRMVSPISIDTEERKGISFIALTATLQDGTTKKFSLRKMFEVCIDQDD